MMLADRLRASLSATADVPLPYTSDMRRAVRGPGTPAAVLAAFTDRAEPGLILTQRPTTMRRHAGQVALPGGRIDQDDADAIAAALREAEEEIALPPHAVEVIGSIGPYRTVTGFDIVPVIGVVAPDLPLVPHDAEVAAVFEVPAAWALDRRNFAERSVMFEGETRRYTEAMWGDYRIWGATAAMLANLSVRLAW